MLDDSTTPPGQLQDRIRVAHAGSSERGRIQILVLGVVAVGVAVLGGAIWLLNIEDSPPPAPDQSRMIEVVEDLEASDSGPDSTDDASELLDLGWRSEPDPPSQGRADAIAGAVLTDSKPVGAGLELWAWRTIDGEPQGEPRRTKTDERGRFLIAPLSGRHYLVEAVGENAFTASPSTVELGSSREAVDLRLELTTGLELSGYVLDPDDRAVDGAQVRATPMTPKGPGFDPRPPRVGTSTPSGEYQIEGLRPGVRYRVEAQCEYHRPVNPPKTLQIVQNTRLDLILCARGLVAGKVRLREDSVALVALDDGEFTTRTDRDGLFRFVGVPPSREPIEIFAVSDDLRWFGRTRFYHDGRNRDGLEVTLEPASAVLCRVLDALGKPVPRARVSLQEETPTGWQVPRSWRLAQKHRLLTEATGEMVLEGLEPDKRYRVREVDPRLLPDGSGTVMFKGLDGAVDLVTTIGALLQGSVTTKGGHPASGLQVLVRREGDIVARETVEEDGHYRFAALYPGEYRVEVGWRDEAIAPWKEVDLSSSQSTTVDFEVRGGSRLHGSITDVQGLPIAGALVKLTLRDGGFQTSTETRSDGRYHFESLIPGRYQIDVTGEAWAPGRGAVELGWQEDAEEDLRLESALGVVVKIQGAREDVVTVKLVPAEGPAEELSLLGREVFRFGQVARGRGELFAHTARHELVARRAITVEDQNLPIRLVLEESHSIRGRVLGHGIAGAQVRAVLTPDGDPVKEALVAPSGEFRLDGLFPGPYFLSIDGSEAPPMKVIAGQQRRPVELPYDG